MDKSLKERLKGIVEDIVEEFHELILKDGYKDDSIERGVFNEKGWEYVEAMEDKLVELTIRTAKMIIAREEIEKKFSGVSK